MTNPAQILSAPVPARLIIGDEHHEGICSKAPVVCKFESLDKTFFSSFTYGSGQQVLSKCLAIRFLGNGSVELEFKKTSGPCGVPLLNRHYKDVSPEKLRFMAGKANRESKGRFGYDLMKHPDRLEDLQKQRPNFFELVTYVGASTGVPAEILLSVMDRESHFNPRAHTAVYAGLGQFDKVAWKNVTSSAIFTEVYQHAFPGRAVPARGEDVFADVLAIAINGLNASSRYKVRPGLTEKFFMTMEAVHRKGINGASRIVKLVKEKKFDFLPKGYKGRFEFVKAIHCAYERIGTK